MELVSLSSQASSLKIFIQVNQKSCDCQRDPESVGYRRTATPTDVIVTVSVFVIDVSLRFMHISFPLALSAVDLSARSEILD